MKTTVLKWISLALAAVMLFALAPAGLSWAEEGSQPATPPVQGGNAETPADDAQGDGGENEDKQTKEEEYEDLPNAKLNTDIRVDDRTGTVTVHSRLSGVKPTEFETGEFHFALEDGSKATDQGKSTIEAEGVFDRVTPGKHQLTVTFIGQFQVSSGDVPVKKTQTLSFQVKSPPVDRELDVTHELIADNGYVVFYAKIPGTRQARGTWTFTFNGQTVVRKDVAGVRQQAGWEEFADEVQIGKPYTATVQFKGVIDGKYRELKANREVILVAIDMKTSCTEKGLRVDGWLTGARQAQGEWDVTYSDLKGHVGKHFSERLAGTRYSHIFPKGKLKPGQYELFVNFLGQTNGAPTSLYTMDGIELKKGDPCLGTGEGKPGDGVKPDDGKPGTPDRGDSPADEAENGGNLPGTSVSYPTFALIGGGILLLGLILTIALRHNRRPRG